MNTISLNKLGKGFHGKLSTIIRWHNFDPVDSFELNRNEIIYTFQKNRNPFIDRPEFVDLIWGDITSIEKPNIAGVIIFPNPADEYITISYQKPFKAMIYSIEGRLVKEISEGNQPIFITELAGGLYIIKITSDEGVFIERFIKN